MREKKKGRGKERPKKTRLGVNRWIWVRKGFHSQL
jgi:hypothetical protein